MLPVVLALCVLVAARAIGWKDAIPLAPFLLFQRLRVPGQFGNRKFTRPQWSGMGADLAGASDHRGTRMWFYLPNYSVLIPLSFIYPRWEIHSFAVDGLFTLTGSNSWLVGCGAARKGGPRRILLPPPTIDLTVSDTCFFSVYFFRYSFVSDHFQYLASMGTLALVGSAMTEGFRRLVVACVAVALPYFCGWYFAAPVAFGCSSYMAAKCRFTTTHTL